MARDLPRLFVDDDLAEDAKANLTKNQTHYVLNVIRCKQGDQVLAFNGKHGEWKAVLVLERQPKKGEASLRVVSQSRQQTPELPDIEYWFAPLKQARLDYVAQKGTEMGAAALRPVITERTQVRKINSERIRANAVEAAEQCGLLSVPKIYPAESLEDALNKMSPDRTLIFLDENATQKNNPVRTLKNLKAESVAVLVGPEGGFSDSEQKMLRARGNVCIVSLGERILRADTAAVAAMTLVQATIGDW